MKKTGKIWVWGSGMLYAVVAVLAFYLLRFVQWLDLPPSFAEMAEFIKVAVNVNYFGSQVFLRWLASPFMSTAQFILQPWTTRLILTLVWEGGLFFLLGLAVGRTLVPSEDAEEDEQLTNSQRGWRLFEWLLLGFILISILHGVAWMVSMNF